MELLWWSRPLGRDILRLEDTGGEPTNGGGILGGVLLLGVDVLEELDGSSGLYSVERLSVGGGGDGGCW